MKTGAKRREDKKMKTAAKEMNTNEIKQVNGGGIFDEYLFKAAGAVKDFIEEKLMNDKKETPIIIDPSKLFVDNTLNERLGK